MSQFHFHVNVEDAQRKINQISDLSASLIKQSVETISVATREFILEKVQSELKGYKTEAYLGKNNENVRWSKIGDGMWMVEVDPKAAWIEEGRPKMFMDWLLKNAKTSKSGSKYKAIPMPIDKGAGKEPGWKQSNPAIASLAKKILKDNNINLKKIERDDAGKPLVGIMKNIPTQVYQKKEDRSLWSMPRSPEMAAQIGLRPHEGIHYLEGLMVVQRPNPKAKHGVTREAITYRTISSKHEQEGRWEYPEVKPLNAIPEAYEWAKKAFEESLAQIELQLVNITGP